MQVILSYEEVQKFEYCCQINQIKIIEAKYEEKISCKIEVPFNEKERFLKEVEKRQVNIENWEIVKEKNIRKR